MPTLPIRDYLYLAAILVLLLGFGIYTHHERSVGSAAVVASDQKAVQAQQERNSALQTAAALATSINNGDYKREIAIPIHDAPVPVGLCGSARSSGPVSSAAAPDGSGTVAPVNGAEDASAIAEVQRLTEFADSAVQIGRDADAQIEALQKDNQVLRQEMGAGT